jgi:hypothetical protein
MRNPNDIEGARIYISTSAEVKGYLQDLAEIGIHGKTKSEVAKTLVGYEIERLIREGVLQLRRKPSKRRASRRR